MVGVYLYFVILLLIIFLCVFILDKLLKTAPIKIKLISLLVLSLMILRYVVLILFSIIQDQKYIYYIKYVTFLQYIYIPAILFTAYYIFRRSEKLKFSISYVILVTYIIIYFLAVIIYEPTLSISLSFGYVISFSQELIPTLIFLISPMTILVLAIVHMDRRFVNIQGLRLLIITSIIIILESMLKLSGVYIYPYSIISELLTILVFNYSLGLFKRQ